MDALPHNCLGVLRETSENRLRPIFGINAKVGPWNVLLYKGTPTIRPEVTLFDIPQSILLLVLCRPRINRIMAKLVWVCTASLVLVEGRHNNDHF